ncbi:acyl carrier protein [Vagococcus silagei]|uniref:Acyl carrier protein n=1 Tax=Vagococcus silagei TaxID=2508885 RepID=A0A4S3B468_9ENTE|nr:acyl carrier protein [Vagococcus silagei]THB61268.1 acyl carrier protein [Vagococcus silagei]
MTTTFEKIQAIIIDQLGKEEEEVLVTTKLKDELEADSLDLFQIMNDIEDEFEDFDVKIETDEGLETVQDLVDYVDNQIKANK